MGFMRRDWRGAGSGSVCRARAGAGERVRTAARQPAAALQLDAGQYYGDCHAAMAVGGKADLLPQCIAELE